MSALAPPVRLPLVEYGDPAWTVAGAAARHGLDPTALLGQLAHATTRIRAALGTRTARLDLDETGVRAEAFAGLLRLGSGVELEVAPKFLGGADPTWREDFFAVATLTHFGRLLPADALLAERGHADDLATLAGRALVELVHANQRRPLRTYRTRRAEEFSGDGELDPESLLTPGPDGFALERLALTTRNPYNATLRAAAAALVPEVRDPDTRKHLERIVQALGEQPSGRDVGRRRALPGRSRGWQGAYDLSCDVLDGFGVRYGADAALAPGFLLDTWRAWQDLVGLALRMALPARSVRAQAAHWLGDRTFAGARQPALVTPDYLVDGAPPLVVDAKYKGRADRGRTAVSEADLYEALAFLEATGAPVAVLLYPAVPAVGPTAVPAPPTGTCRTFERIDVGTRRVYAAEIELRGVSRVGGLPALGTGLAAWLADHALP